MAFGIYPVSIAVDGVEGLTLWAPEWSDGAGHTWTAFLGDDRHVLLFDSERALLSWSEKNPDHALVEHPDWSDFVRAHEQAVGLRKPDRVDLDVMFDVFAASPDSARCEQLSRTLQLVRAIGEACDDDALVEVSERQSYADMSQWRTRHSLPDSEQWRTWAQEATRTWDWVIERVASHVAVVRGGTVARLVEPAADGPWDRDGAELPPELTLLPPRPSLTPTILVTVLLGIWGVIPAAIAASQAKRSGHATRRYWDAFVVTLVLESIALIVVIVSAVANS